MNGQTKFIAWDWNGTLQDDFPVAYQCANIIFEQIGKPLIDEETYRKCFEVPIAKFYLNVGLNKEEVERDIEKMQGIFFDNYAKLILEVDFRAGARGILDYAQQNGVVHVIFSNHMISQVVAGLERLGVRESFFDVLARPDRGHHYPKSKKQYLQDFVKQHQLRPENGLIIGDTPEEIHIAHDLGLVGVAITEGYATKDRLDASNPHHIIHSLHDLEPILQERGFVS